MTPGLQRYWIQFEDCTALRLGCGVTAFDREDALSLLQSRVFQGSMLPALRETRQDVDISTLDAGHVRPNMGNPTRRGIWFPLGYD